MPQNSKSVRLRNEVTISDIEAVRHIVESTHFFNLEECDIAADLVKTCLENGDSSGYFFVFAEQQKQLVGYACFGPIPGTVNSYDIYWIVVDPIWQSNGIGRLLINTTETAILKHNGKRIYIETAGRDKYTPTRAFYARLGYDKIAELPEYYGPGDAKIIYQKVLL